MYIFLYELFSIFAKSAYIIFVANNNYAFVPNFYTWSLYAKIHLW
jgi:hypothetical protein